MEEQKIKAQTILPIPSARSFIVQAFRLYLQNIGPILLVGLVPAVVALVDYILSSLGLTGISILTSLLSLIVALLFYPALMIVVTSEKDPSAQTDVFSIYKKSWALLGSYLVLASLVVVAVSGGVLLLIIPGIYVGLMLSFSPFVWLLEGKKGKEALATAWFYVRGNWWKVFWRYFVMGIVLAIIQGIVSGIFSSIFIPKPIALPVSSLPYNIPQSLLTMAAPETTLGLSFLSYFVSMPILMALGFLVYKALKVQKMSQLDEAALVSSRKSVSRFIVLGIIALVLLILAVLGAFSFSLFKLRGLM